MQAYLQEWGSMAPSAQEQEWRVIRRYLKAGNYPDLEVHLHSMCD